MVVPWICVSISKSQAIWRKAKKKRFLHFFVSISKKIEVAAGLVMHGNDNFQKLNYLKVSALNAGFPSSRENGKSLEFYHGPEYES